MADRSQLPTDGDSDARDAGAVDGDVQVAERPADAVSLDDPSDEPRPRRRRLSADGLPASVPRSTSSLVWQARVGLGIGLLGLILATVFFMQNQDLRRNAEVRETVLEAGEITALRVTTFEGATIDQWVADTQSLATGDYADEVATLFDTDIRQGLAENQVESVGEITRSFVQEIDGDNATVFAVVRQTFTSLNQQQPISDELRMEIELDLVDGRWLASDVAVLGPSTVSPVPEGGAGGVELEPLPSEEVGQ